MDSAQTTEPAWTPLAAAERMVVFRPSGGTDAMQHGALVCADWPAWEATRQQPLGFYCEDCSAQQQAQFAAQVRASRWWDRPVFVREHGAPPLADGHAPYAEALRIAERMQAVRHSLKLDSAALHFDERVLYFLGIRDSAQRLHPLRDRHSPALYRYPQVDALAHGDEDSTACLASLTRRNLLEPEQICDRTRHCPGCASAHLHYFDICPHCSGIEIRRASSLHCFACGHVAPDHAFSSQAALVCPQCRAQLRHIGVDYDRPLTQYACGRCHHVFAETGVLARCLDCEATSAPSALDVREIASLRLSASGRAALRAGQLRDSFAALDVANYVEPMYFRRLLDWALATQARHAELRFSLMLLEFQDAAQAVEQLGAARVYLLLDEFARRLHALLRTSDVTTRTEEERLWLFLPYTAARGLAVRVEKLLAEQGPRGDDVLRVQIRHLAVPADARPGETAAQLMARLQAAR